MIEATVMRPLAPILLGLAFLAACSSGPGKGSGGIPPSSDTPPASGLASTGGPELGAWGADTSSFSPTIAPGDDFYRYVNGGWLQTAKLPAGFSSYNAFTDAYLRTGLQLKSLLADIVAAEHPEGSPEQRVGALLRSYVDVQRLNELGLTPIQPDIDAVLAMRTHDDVVRTMGLPFQAGIAEVGVVPDPRDPRRYVVAIEQSGLGMPTPEYYLRTQEPFPGHRKAYRDYVEGVLSRAGIDGASARADSVLALEIAIARKHWSPTETRDAVRMHHPMTPTELAAFAPGFDWAAFLDAQQYSGQATLDVHTDTALRELARLFPATPVETWKSYLLFHTIDSRAPLLSEEWQQANFEFFSGRLSGVTHRRALEDRAVESVSELLGEDLGRAYVKRHFPAANRTMLDEMIGYLRQAYRARLQRVSWMDEETRREAVAKLDRIVTRIGYPDRWHDYSSMRIDPTDLAGNVRRRVAWDKADSLARLKEKRREWEWPLQPHAINAGYVASENSITFPAAILQSPFFDPRADPAVNYGAIGAVIGHEIGHAFDDQGSRYDGDGRLRNWWSAESRARFEQRGAVLVSQYDAYSPIEGMHVNGKLTLGENIGDLGGLSIAYDAYRLYVAGKQNGRETSINGFTGDQMFFIGWAQMWRSISTPEEARSRLLADPHAPREFRTNGVVRNIDAWYEAFGVSADNALYLEPDKRVRIW